MHKTTNIFFFNDTATTEIYTLSLHDALPISSLAVIDEEIGVALANPGVTYPVAFQAQLVDHPAGRSARRILENAAGAFLVERLAGAAFLVADADALENLAERFGGKLQFRRQHNIIGRERSVAVFKVNLAAPERLDSTSPRPVNLNFAHIGTDLRAVGFRVHPQSPAHGAWHADQTLHPPQVVLRAERNRAAQVCCAIDIGEVALQPDVRLRPDQLQHHPGQLAIQDKQVGTATQEPMRDSSAI